MPGLNTGPTRGKTPDGWTSSQGVWSDKCCLFNSAKLFFEIIAHQRNRQIGGALQDANSQLLEGRRKLSFTLHVDRSNAHTTFFEISLCSIRQQAQARPIGGSGFYRRARFRDDEAAVDQALQGFLDLVGRKILLQFAEDLRKTLSTLAYCGGERAIELAMKKELPVFGIEAHHFPWQHIHREIRREPRNVFAVMLRNAVSVIACHELSARAGRKQ